MATNIRSTRYLTGRLLIRRGTALDLRRKIGKDLPEVNLLQQVKDEGSLDDMVPIYHPWWYGEGSAWAYHEKYFKSILGSTRGEADILLIWADGMLSGMRVRDGVVEERPVKITLD